MTRPVLLMGCLVAGAAPAADPGPTCWFAGCGGVYFLAEPGELRIELYKRDRNASGAPTELRAILAGPDRQVLGEQSIPFAGQAKGSGYGPVQHLTLTATVRHRGIHVLNITVSNDRYGNDVAWGFTTNCPKYLIETARGHRDARHEEPLVLVDPDRPANVCFRPRTAALKLEVAALPAGVTELSLFDAGDQLVRRIPVTAGKAAAEFPADPTRATALWRLHFPRARAELHADGLTRWTAEDLLPDQCLWTPDPASWFAWPENRWLLMPYRVVQFGAPGQTGRALFEVRNPLASERTVALALETDGPALAVEPPPATVKVPAKGAVEVPLRYTVPATGTARVQLRATPADGSFSTWSSLQVTAGEAPAARPLKLPLTLRPYAHEREQLGYDPAYPTESQPYFDPADRPYVVDGRRLWRQEAGQWTAVDVPAAVTGRTPAFEGPISGPSSPKVAFDRDGDLYLLANSGRKRLLLHSADQGQTFHAYTIPIREDRGGGTDFEQFSGHNPLSGPPPITCNSAVPTAPDPKLFWRRVNELNLIVPRKVNGRLEMGQPIAISPQSLGLSGHSGTPSSVVSRGDKVHVVWGEATEPGQAVPGVPTFVVTYDRATGQLGRPALIGHGPPANDIHNTPTITMDSQGYLHAITGTHGRPFMYAKSLQPNDAGGGWTAPEPTGEGLSQTYLGLVCGADDTLHLIYRLWWSRTEPFPLASYASLAYQRKRPGQPWEPPQVLLRPAFSEYGVYYHRLTVNHAGQLFCSYDAYTTYWFYRNDQRARKRAVLTSPDGGTTWRLW